MERYLTLSTAYNEHITPHETLSQSIPSSSPSYHPTPSDPFASSSSSLLLTPEGSFLLSRLINLSHTLELRLSSFTNTSSDPSTPPTFNFHFPAPILPHPFFKLVEQEGLEPVLRVYAVTEDGWLFKLSFKSNGNQWFYAGLDETGRGWCEEIKLVSLEGRKPTLVNGFDDGRLLVACQDGFGLYIDWDHTGFQDFELRPSSSRLRSLIPSFSSSPPSSSQIIAFAASKSLLSAFGITRDRKLKVWSLENGACIRVVDLPRSSSSSSELELYTPPTPTSSSGTDSPKSKSGSSSLLLPSHPQPLLKLHSLTDLSHKLIIHFPSSSFNSYTISTSTRGEVVELVPLEEHLVPKSSRGETLVDFEVGGDEKGTKLLWGVWDDKGEVVVRCKRVEELEVGGPQGLLLTSSGEEEVEEVLEDEEEGWYSISSGSASLSYSPTYFDELFLKSFPLPPTPEEITQLFSTHIFHPSRYTLETLSSSLYSYIDLVLSSTPPSQLPHPLPLPLTSLADDHFPSIPSRILATIGCHLSITEDISSGKKLIREFATKLRLEFSRFVAILEEERKELFRAVGLGLVKGEVLVLRKGGVSVVTSVDQAILLSSLGAGTSTKAFSNTPPSQLLSTFPILSPNSIRRDLLLLLPLLSLFSTTSSSTNSIQIESLLVERSRAPVLASTEEIALEVYDELSELLSSVEKEMLREGLKELVMMEGSLQALWTVVTVPTSSSEGSQGGQTEEGLTELSRALLADLVERSLESRFELCKGLVGVLVWVLGDETLGAGGGSGGLERAEELLSASWASLNSLAGLKWVVGLEGLVVEKEGDEGDMVSMMGGMKVGALNDGVPTALVESSSLLHSLLLSPRYSPSISPLLPLSSSLLHSLSTFLNRSGLLSQKRQVVTKPADVEFGMWLIKRGKWEWGEEWTRFAGPGGGAGMRYVRGRALLESGEEGWEEAEKECARAAAGLYEQQPTSLPSDSSGLSLVLPSGIDSLPLYYHHLVHLFASVGAHSPVIHFARLAIEEAEVVGVEVEEEVRKDCWLKLFRACSEEKRWEEAYGAVVGMPFVDTKTTCLGHLVSVLCQNGQATLLTSWSFVGLQAELERLLSFRARNADPLAEPNYARVLYSYHVAKGDYRSAGATMFQYARRIGEVANRLGDYRAMATIQCQSYLAAANALTLVDPKHAWVAVFADESRAERGSKRRKLTYYIPEEEFEGASGPPDVVDLEDVRKEYATTLARLELAEDFPELKTTNSVLDPESAVALFARTGAFDAAFLAARSLEVDMSSLFETLTEKCVGLSLNGVSATENVDWVSLNEEASTWEGNLASKAWRLLQAHLTRHDDSITYRYRLVVLEKALAVNRGGKLPPWLVDFFLVKDPAALLRTLVKSDRLADAFSASLSTIKASTIKDQTFSSTLPYSIFDQLLAIEPNDSPALSAEGLAERQKSLREALSARFTGLEKAQISAERKSRR